MKIDPKRVARIRSLNDAFRSSFVGGRVLVTRGVTCLPDEVRSEVLSKVRTFNCFDEENDPHREHDFVSIEVNGSTFFAKIDYYNLRLDGGSDDPADANITRRVLTIMCASEY